MLFATAANAQRRLLQGINHTPIVVRDLEKAQADFRAMGFTIKPGHLHSDGIRNAHVKFADGSELELITAAAAVDELTAEYRDKIAHGDGPVYYGLYSPDPAALLRRLHAEGMPLKENEGLLTFPMGNPLHAIFFGPLGPARDDRPEYFVHRNTAQRLSGFWVRDRPELRALFRNLDVPLIGSRACGPLGDRVIRAKLPKGDVYLVAQMGPGDELAARVDVKSIAAAENTLRSGGFAPQRYACDKSSIWLPPSAAHGIWLQLREARH
ncbi:MAG TPA: VOC family protein [Acidobacteriaceae bacterium]|nr:VOC family protein [Acidobacteriaceae bacterium]